MATEASLPRSIFVQWWSSLPSDIKQRLGFAQHLDYYVELAKDYYKSRLNAPSWRIVCAACICHFFVTHTRGELRLIGTLSNIADAFYVAKKSLCRCWNNLLDFETERDFE